MPPEHDLLHLLHDLRGRLDGDLSLETLAARAGWSKFHLHRAFRRAVGETPKQYSLRLRLERAAAALLTRNDTVLDIALAAGFASHEVFTRAFRRQFGVTPVHYRAAALPDSTAAERARHFELIEEAGPCIGLFHFPLDQTNRRPAMPTPLITRKQLPAQPVLFIRKRTAIHELPLVLGELFGKVFAHSQKTGVALAGRPFVRYAEVGAGLCTIEAGMPVASDAPGEGEIEAGVVGGGPVATTVHAGPYERLRETYTAIERWMEANGTGPGGAPWESYLTDPAEYPDPADWRTEVNWPLAG